MLLPSALSCDGMSQPKPQRPSKPILPSFDRYDPCQRSRSPVIGLIASCRALQNIIGERFSSTPSPSLERTSGALPMGSPFGDPTPPPVCLPAPRRGKKRRRDDIESDKGNADQRRFSERLNDVYSTPKRRRIVPFEMPRGLQASDFEALACPTLSPQSTPRASKVHPEIEMPEVNEPETPNPSSENQHAWSENDDRLLVETVLSKLNLSSREWNDCATRLGKDKDSIGRRWRLLLGKGDIGLRRGVGRKERFDLNVRSW